MTETLPERIEAIPDVAEDATLEELEAVVDANLGGFLRVGRALWAIQERKLYKKTHRSFDLYCRERWHFTADTGYRTIDQAKAQAALPAGSPLPSKRAATRFAARGASKGPLTSGDAKKVRGKTNPPVDAESRDITVEREAAERAAKALLEAAGDEPSESSAHRAVARKEKHQNVVDVESAEKPTTKAVKAEPDPADQAKLDAAFNQAEPVPDGSSPAQPDEPPAALPEEPEPQEPSLSPFAVLLNALSDIDSDDAAKEADDLQYRAVVGWARDFQRAYQQLHPKEPAKEPRANGVVVGAIRPQGRSQVTPNFKAAKK